MITINFDIKNPWSDRWKSVFDASGSTPIKNKFWEVQLIKTNDIIGFEFSFTTKQDHAGLTVNFKLLGHELHFQIYDNRHWDYDEGRWYTYNEEQGLL